MTHLHHSVSCALLKVLLDGVAWHIPPFRIICIFRVLPHTVNAWHISIPNHVHIKSVTSWVTCILEWHDTLPFKLMCKNLRMLLHWQLFLGGADDMIFVFIPIICISKVLLHQQIIPLMYVPQFILQNSPFNLTSPILYLYDKANVSKRVLTAATLIMEEGRADEGGVTPLFRNKIEKIYLFKRWSKIIWLSFILIKERWQCNRYRQANWYGFLVQIVEVKVQLTASRWWGPCWVRAGAGGRPA